MDSGRRRGRWQVSEPTLAPFGFRPTPRRSHRLSRNCVSLVLQISDANCRLEVQIHPIRKTGTEHRPNDVSEGGPEKEALKPEARAGYTYAGLQALASIHQFHNSPARIPRLRFPTALHNVGNDAGLSARSLGRHVLGAKAAAWQLVQHGDIMVAFPRPRIASFPHPAVVASRSGGAIKILTFRSNRTPREYGSVSIIALLDAPWDLGFFSIASPSPPSSPCERASSNPRARLPTLNCLGGMWKNGGFCFQETRQTRFAKASAAAVSFLMRVRSIPIWEVETRVPDRQGVAPQEEKKNRKKMKKQRRQSGSEAS